MITLSPANSGQRGLSLEQGRAWSCKAQGRAKEPSAQEGWQTGARSPAAQQGQRQGPHIQESKTKGGASKPGSIQWSQARRHNQRKGAEAEEGQTPESDSTETPEAWDIV